MSIEGSLDEHTFLNIIDIVSKRRLSGGLQIDHQSMTGLFHLDNGQLATARFGQLSGVAAVHRAISLQEGHFRFVPTDEVPSTEFKDPNERLLLQGLLGIPIAAPAVEDHLDFTSVAAHIDKQKVSYWVGSVLLLGLLAAGAITAFRSKTPVTTETPVVAPTETKDVANNVSDEVKPSQADVANSASDEVKASPQVTDPSYTPTIPPETPKLQRNETAKEKDSSPSQVETPRPEPTVSKSSDITPAPTNAPAMKAEKDSFKEIPVVIRIENGRVTEAYIDRRDPKSAAYEATALFLARQRRYPANTTGRETIVIKVARQP
jgi:hypothetical protein